MVQIAALLSYIIGDSALTIAGMWLGFVFALSLKRALFEPT